MRYMKYIDDSCSFYVLSERLENAYKEHGKLIIAYDLDDTVRPFRSSQCDEVVGLIKKCKKILNAYFIAYTANSNYEKNWNTIKELDLPCDSMNCYPDDPVFDNFKKDLSIEPQPKLYFNILLDDKSFGLAWACIALNNLCDKVEKGIL